MQYFRGSNNLPFDPERIDTRNMVNNRPNLGRIDLGDLTNFAGEIVDALIIQIQDNAERSPLRVFAFNYWADRNFNNRQFGELISVFAAHVECILLTQPQADPVAVIDGEAELFMTAASAYLTEQFPQITEYLPQEAEPAIKNSISDWHAMMRDIRAAQRQVGVGRSSYGRQGGGQQYGRAQPGGLNRMGNQGGGQRGGYYGGQQRDTSNLRPAWEQEKDYQRAEEVSVRSGFNSIVSPTRQNEPANAELRKVDLNAKPTPSQDTKPKTYTRNGSSVQNSQRPFDQVKLGDGRVMVPAFLSEWKANVSLEHPPFVFNRQSHILYHVKMQDGTVLESIQEKVPQMEYLDHELDEKLKQVHRHNQGIFAKEVAIPQIQLARKIVPIESGKVAVMADQAQREALDKAGAPRQLTRAFMVTSLEEALFQAKLEANRLDGTVDFLEFQVVEAENVCLQKKALPAVLELGRETTYEGFTNKLLELHRSDAINDELLETLDKRMTEAFNRYNTKRLFLKQTVDSFMEDLDDLMELVTTRYGDQVAAKLQAGAKDVILSAASVLTGETLTQYLNNLGDAKDKLDQPAVFCNRYSVTQLPWTLYEMERVWRMEGIVTEDNAKPFHEALAAIFARTQTNGTHDHILLTSDDQKVYAYRSAGLASDFVITAEPPAHMAKFLATDKF